MIKEITSKKNVLLLNDKDGFSNLKIQLFNVLDAARDVQLKIESAQYRLAGNPHKINRFIGKKANWYYQHKYAVRTADNCEMDKKTVEGEIAKLTAAYHKFYAVQLPELGESVLDSLTREQSDKTMRKNQI